MAYDYSKLSGKIKEVFGTNAAFAKAMGLSERSISSKLRGKVGWKQSEIENACQLLSISRSEVVEYFFNLKVHSA